MKQIRRFSSRTTRKPIFTIRVTGTLLFLWICYEKESFLAQSGSETKEDRISHCQNLENGLINVLRESTHDLGLRNVTVGEDSVPGLDMSLLRSAYENQKVFFLGDSTLFYLMKWLYVLMNRMEESLSTTDLTKKKNMFITTDMDLETANLIINPDMDPNVHLKGYPPPYVIRNTHLRYMGYADTLSIAACDFSSYFSLERISTYFRPNVLVVNMGLHWLHFVGAAKGRDVPICMAHRWTYYERDFLETMLATAHKAKTEILIFKTTNLICDSKFRGEYQNATEIYSPPSSRTISTCLKKLKNRQQSSSQHYNLTVGQLERYCRHGTFNDAGASYLNDRLKAFVESKQKRLKSADGVQLLLFNDHDVESCEYSKITDGRHYHPLNLVRIRILANMITCLQKR